MLDIRFEPHHRGTTCGTTQAKASERGNIFEEFLSPMLTDMFVLKIPVLEKIVRPILVYLFLVLMLRVFGKRELAQLNPFDLVVLLSLSNTVQNAIIGDDNSLVGGLVGAFSLLSMNYLVIRFLFKHRRLDQIVEGNPTVLIEKGKVVQDNLAKELMTQSELATIAHRQGFPHLRDVERCILEPGGNFRVEGKEPGAPDRRHQELLQQLDLMNKKLERLEHKAGL
jgi:uncharacterized membrane protein YcaP (DUF421 family)